MGSASDRLRSMNPNVLYTLVYTGMYNLGVGVWSTVVLGPYLYQLSGQSTLSVGYAEGLQGALQALAALPAGWLADSISRQRILRVSMVLGLCTCMFTILVLLSPMIDSTRFLLLGTSLCLFGVYDGVTAPTLEAQLADSVASGTARSAAYTLKYSISVIAQAGGPLLSLVLFSTLGNHWDGSTLSRVFLLGVGVCAVGMVFLHRLRDDWVLGQESDPAPSSSIAGISTSHTIPALLATSDLIYGLASGMTIKFFPLFFEYESGWSPVTVNTVYVVSPILIAGLSMSASSLSLKYGRVQTILLIEVLGIALMVVLACIPKYWTSIPVTATLYVLRTALMNSSSPLAKSILMDHVHKSTRARWSSVDSLTSFGWSGSAMLGGYLIEKYDYGVTFLITALIQLLGWSLLWFLIPLVPAVPPAVPDQHLQLPLLSSTKDTDGTYIYVSED